LAIATVKQREAIRPECHGNNSPSSAKRLGDGADDDVPLGVENVPFLEAAREAGHAAALERPVDVEDLNEGVASTRVSQFKIDSKNTKTSKHQNCNLCVKKTKKQNNRVPGIPDQKEAKESDKGRPHPIHG